MATRSYIGKGKIYLKPYGSAEGFTAIGNASQLQANIAEDKKELLDYTSAGGGLVNSLVRISSVATSITVHDLSPENLAIALRGTTSATTSVVAIVAESLVCYTGLNPTARIINTSVAPVVTSSPAGTTYVAGTDYNISPAGITLINDTLDGDTLLVSYTPVADDLIQALTSSAQEYTLLFDGLNEAASGDAVIIKMHKVKFSPTSALDVIGDDFAGLEMSADVLADTTITTSGLSKYMTIRMAQ